jgi:hypothetical protein
MKNTAQGTGRGVADGSGCVCDPASRVTTGSKPDLHFLAHSQPHGNRRRVRSVGPLPFIVNYRSAVASQR